MMDNRKWIVAWGTITDGFAFVGPFDSPLEATEHMDAFGSGWVGEVARLDPPEEDEGA